MHKIMLGAGCFWGVQYFFDQVPGVTETIVGYSGGKSDNPTYEEVCSHTTGHAEVVLITYSDRVKLDYLLQLFFRMHDPTQLNRQGPDIGDQYRSAIFYYDDDQKKTAEKVKNLAQTQYKDPVVTEISPASKFYKAEEYHQKFTQKTDVGQCHIEYKDLERIVARSDD